MSFLLPSSIIPEIIKTSFIVIDSYDNGNIKGKFLNLVEGTAKQFDDTLEFIFKIDEMLEHFLIELDESSDDEIISKSTEILSNEMIQLMKEHNDIRYYFALRIYFVRQAQWKGIVEWVSGGTKFEFKTTEELLDFMVKVLDKNVYSCVQLE